MCPVLPLELSSAICYVPNAHSTVFLFPNEPLGTKARIESPLGARHCIENPIRVFHYFIVMGSEGMGLLEKTHLPDENFSCLCCGPSRCLQSLSLMVSQLFGSSKPQREGRLCILRSSPLRRTGNVGVDADRRRVACRAI